MNSAKRAGTKSNMIRQTLRTRRVPRWTPLLIAMFCPMGVSTCLRGDDTESQRYQLTDIHPSGIGGTIIMHGAGEVSEAMINEFATAAGGPDARLFVITFNGPQDDRRRGEEIAAASEENHRWGAIDAESLHLVQVSHPEDLKIPDLIEPLHEATGVWFEEGYLSDCDWTSDALKDALQSVLDRGGIISGTGCIALLADRYTIDIAGETRTLPGLGLMPQVAITLSESPLAGYVSLHVEPNTIAFIHERTIGVVGNGSVKVTPHYHVSTSDDVRYMRDGDIADLTALRRMCTLGPRFRRADEEPAACEVPSGSLMIVGGGGFTDEMLNRFVELAGGESANIVVVPSAEEDPQIFGRHDVQQFLDAGAASAVVLHTHDRAVADSDEFIAPLADATGIWFGGGRQWRLLDAYTGTRTETAMREVLERGGVIGGSSAGATIQGDYLVRGNPLGNTDMMSAGYEDGFCFLPGCAIDQHFTARNRHPDMALFKKHLPLMLGIGIDETTALVVSGRSAEVMGHGKVFFYDGATSDLCEQRTEVSAGQVYDLIEQQILE